MQMQMSPSGDSARSSQSFPAPPPVRSCATPDLRPNRTRKLWKVNLRRPPLPLAAWVHRGSSHGEVAWRYRDLGSWRLCQEQLLERRPRRALEPAPLRDWNQDGGLNALLSDDLRTFIEARLQQLAEMSRCVLDRPPSCGLICSHALPLRSYRPSSFGWQGRRRFRQSPRPAAPVTPHPSVISLPPEVRSEPP